jgi:tRNA threonylcarbamoyladenosine biosynthesis protein TsaE
MIFESEQALCRVAAQMARGWRDAGLAPLIIGLAGDLGVGKTTFVRAMLEGLGYAGRVPSPTYTLLEHYAVGDLNIIHLDLYRLAEARELEFLGLRDWLADPAVWVLAEWPEKGGAFAESLDLRLTLAIRPDESRSIVAVAQSPRGERALQLGLGADFN